MIIQSVCQMLIILMKAKSGKVFHKTPKLLPLFIDFQLQCCIEGEVFRITLSGRSQCQIYNICRDQILAFSGVLNVEPHRLKPMAPPHASGGGTLRSILHYVLNELPGVPSSHSSTV